LLFSYYARKLRLVNRKRRTLSRFIDRGNGKRGQSSCKSCSPEGIPTQEILNFAEQNEEQNDIDMIVREWREKPELTDFSWGVTEKVVRHARDEELIMRAPCL
jgi:hypothetical protein